MNSKREKRKMLDFAMYNNLVTATILTVSRTGLLTNRLEEKKCGRMNYENNHMILQSNMLNISFTYVTYCTLLSLVWCEELVIKSVD